MSRHPLSPDSLPNNCKAVLYALVTAFPGKGKTSLLKLLRTMGICDPGGKLLDVTTLPGLLQLLQDQGWVDVEQRNEGQYFVVAAQRRNSVLLSLLGAADGSLRLYQINASLPALVQWQVPGKPRVLQELWLSLLSADCQLLQQSLHLAERLLPVSQWPDQHPMQLLQSDPTGLEVFGQLDETVRGLLLEDHLRLNNSLLGPVGGSYALAQHEMMLRPSPALGLQLMQQALWRGDWKALQHYGGQDFPLTFQSLQSMLHGKASETLQLLRSWLTDQRRLTKKRKIDLPPLLNALYCLALIAENDSQHHAALKQALVLGEKQNYGRAYSVLSQLFEQLQGNTPELSYLRPVALNGLDGLLLALALYWLDAPLAREQDWRKTLEDYRGELDQQGYTWLAAEFDALIAVQFGVPRKLHDLHHDTGLKPLATLHQRQEAWQHALSALSQLKPASAPTSPADKKTTRLAWMLNLHSYSNQLEPREQKLGAKGQWSKGRSVALKRLRDEGGSLDFLCEQDRQAISVIQAQSFYSQVEYALPLGVALPRLVGHPALFWHDAPDVRVELQAGHASLHLQAQDGQIHLRLEPLGIVTADTYYLHQQTPTRLQVYSVNSDLRQIAKIIGDGLRVPQSGKAQLIDAVSAIAPLLPIHSDLPELAVDLEHEHADTRLYAHLLPLAEGLRLQLLVRPLAESSWFRPGQGAQNVLGERDGKPLQVCRDLAGERQTLQQVLHACPGLANANSDGQEWQLDQPQDALQVLGELHALDGNQVHCVWPEGERMRIKGRLKLNELKLGLRKQGEWFVLQGEIAFDDGKVLQLRQLLELLKASPGRFLKLDERDWLALDETLRKRLDELTHLADRVTDQGLRLSPLTAPLLAGLAAEVGEFNADKSWQAHLEKLQSLRDYQPQLPRTLLADLRAYQHEGFMWLARLAEWGVGACLADDMGLGKTIQILAILLQRAANGPQLVVAPTSVTLNWLAESRRFAPQLKLHLYQQERNLTDLGPGDLIITSYGLLQQDSAAFAACCWNSVVLDEAQAIKNAQTKRSQAVMALQADFRVVSTGTPVENHLGELWNLFRFINPGLLGSQESFSSRFATPIEQGDAAARRALKALIQPFILRRLKSQVLDELPPRTEITYKVPLSDDEAHHYEALRQQALNNVSDLAPGAGRSFQILTEITRLRRFCCHPTLVIPESTLPGSKLQAFTAIVEELLDNGHKALVFSQYVDHLSIARTWLAEKNIAYQYLDGSVPAKERESRVNAFQAGVGEVFLISLKAGGSGLNLTAADYVIHLDPWWNPAVEDQASDRAYRIGQQRPVTIYRLVAENTIEEQIVALHSRKRDLAQRLLEGGEVSAKLDADALLTLLAGAVH
ncbi:DEAD/DEAH box helicase [Pseudomonas rubra]|uniref:DEAD/DEAH box helicase n=1 Tax=Pseudomonas rubra TaxID=2942627 RepID=A0ABT5PA59_9PSED|nr:DEAD/DEAH box helicase [Pseudomonas rubra]MDD1015195.1 DEAD/DEAH box helicase [Pseudomonas rubra]MDD1037849.1 DEAD/DEAH box helicase [Pseudomonas rubra]MDD1152823.1 DEAD/DEAH box helicase [Pseudomonas rubra]